MQRLMPLPGHIRFVKVWSWNPRVAVRGRARFFISFYYNTVSEPPAAPGWENRANLNLLKYRISTPQGPAGGRVIIFLLSSTIALFQLNQLERGSDLIHSRIPHPVA